MVYMASFSSSNKSCPGVAAAGGMGEDGHLCGGCGEGEQGREGERSCMEIMGWIPRWAVATRNVAGTGRGATPIFRRRNADPPGPPEAPLRQRKAGQFASTLRAFPAGFPLPRPPLTLPISPPRRRGLHSGHDGRYFSLQLRRRSLSVVVAASARSSVG